jgi:hypothetical protein
MTSVGIQEDFMAKIILSSEQAEILAKANEPVGICLPNGSIAGWLRGDMSPKEPMFTPEEIAEAERRANSPGPWHTTKQVLDHLRSLEER